MGAAELRTRDQIEDCYKWNIGEMIEEESIIEPRLEQLRRQAESFREKYEGSLTGSSEMLAAALREKDALWRELEKYYTYAHMKRDEDNANDRYQGLVDRCMSVIAAVSASQAFLVPELLAAPEDTILGYLAENEDLAAYGHAVRNILREKAHVLSPAEENLLAQMSEVTSATGDIFTMLNNADLRFGRIKDAEGRSVELTHGSYIALMESRDRNVRRDAYDSMYRAYKGLINTIAAAYSYNTKTDVVTARIRRYGSAREAALSDDNIPAEVYENLIRVVNEHLPAMHRYMELKKRLLGVEELHMYDIYAPVIDIPDRRIPYEEGLEIIRSALRPMGEEYLRRMNEGIGQGWIDVYENRGKTSGAYSFGCYDSYPYILLNYTDTLQDVFTIVHEMGHSMHSSYTREHQPYIYGSHSIFTAETASTVNESLLMAHLFSANEDPEMRKYLLSMHLEAFRTTLFRQTMFAEFEDLTHRAVESGAALTAEWLCDQYEALNGKYYGPAVAPDDTIRYEWARIPHFYNAFYVYKYATGYSAATAICGKLLKEGRPAADRYIEFLKTGESDYPIELLKIAGVDMSSPEPIERAMEKFEELLSELEELVSREV